MDIRKFAVEETKTIELVGADEQPMKTDSGAALTVTVYGPGSKTYARAQAAQQNRMMDRLKRKGKADQTVEEQIEEKARFLTDVTKSMENVEYDGLEGPALYKAVYSDISVGFIADQVAKTLGDWANFSKGSATN